MRRSSEPLVVVLATMENRVWFGPWVSLGAVARRCGYDVIEVPPTSSHAQVRRVARRFPELGFERQRKSFMGSALLSVLVNQTRAAREAVGALRILGDLGVVHERQLGLLLDEALAGKASPWRLQWAWDVLNLETWARVRR